MRGSITGVLLQTNRAALADGLLLASFLDRLNALVGRCMTGGLVRADQTRIPLHIIGPIEELSPLRQSGSLARDHLESGSLFAPGTPILGVVLDVSSDRVGGMMGEQAAGVNASGGNDAVLLFSSLCPLLDVEGSLTLIANHLRYRTHYSYSDTAVPGFFPDCLAVELAREAPDAIREATSPEALRAFVFRNIQDFDLDLHYAEPDLRTYRLSADGQTDRSRSTAHRLLARGLTSHANVREALDDDIEILAPSPSWIEVEWTTRSSGRSTIYPVAEPMDLPPDVQQKILSDLERFPFSRDVTICLGGRGDPMLGPGLSQFVAALAKRPSVRAIMIETEGAALTRKMLETLGSPLAERDVALHVIVRLPSLRLDRYRRWMGSDRLPDVLSLLDSLATDPLPFAVYAEMIRMTDNEDELDAFMERFPERFGESGRGGAGVKPLVGKYSRFAGALPDRAAVDLSPLVKDYCRHLAFDLMITADGRIPLCRQRPGGAESAAALGATDLLRTDLLTVFRSHRDGLALSRANRFEEISPACAACDDWYVFNG